MPIHHSFASLRDHFTQATRGQWETNVFPRTLKLEDGRLSVPFAGYSALRSLTPHAQRQLSLFMSIPFACFREAAPHVQDELFSVAMERLIFPGSRTLTLRGKRSDVRGIVDELCCPFDNLALLRSLWHMRNCFEIQWASIEESALHLRLIDPSTAREVLPGDWLMAGVHIASSEVGARPLLVEPLVYRQKCGNGLIGFGTKTSTLSKVPRWPDGDIGEMLIQAVEEALRIAEHSIEAVGDTASVVIEKPGLLLNSLETPRYRGIIDATLQALDFEDMATRSTLFGLMNAMTQTAQKYPPETRLKIEQMAGRAVPLCLP